MQELDLNAFLITETFLTDRRETKKKIKDFKNEHGLEFFSKNRGSNIARGGAAILTDKRRGTFSPFEPFKTRFETVAAAGSIHGYKRKMVIVCSYMPPGMVGSLDCLEEIVGLVNQAKIAYPDPFIVVGGDFNEFDPPPIIHACNDMRVAKSPPTREDRKIDIILTNFDSKITESSALEPLSDHDGRLSDHNLMFFRAQLPKRTLGKWINITRRKYTPEAELAMGEWLAQQDWRDVLSKEGADLKEKELSKLLEAQLDKEMPLQTFRAKSDEKPWMTNGIRGMIQQKKKIYKRMGFKSQEWKKMKRELRKYCLRRKKPIINVQ